MRRFDQNNNQIDNRKVFTIAIGFDWHRDIGLAVMKLKPLLIDGFHVLLVWINQKYVRAS